MEQPPPDVPPEPPEGLTPEINRRLLWLCLLLPGAATGLGTLLLLPSGGNSEIILNLGMFAVGLTTIACWVGFARCIGARFLGTSRVLLILAYPILQIAIVIGVFFVGCLAIFTTGGFH